MSGTEKDRILKSKIKVLIVDDSILFRSQIQTALEQSSAIEVVGTAQNGKVALEKMQALPVDLVVLDLEMPVLDGIATLKEIKSRGLNCKIILFSSASVSGAEKTLLGLNLGADDFVAKPSGETTSLTPSEKIKILLVPKILSLVVPREVGSTPRPVEAQTFAWKSFWPEVLVIASSTGGPNALTELFTHLKAPLHIPILIAQHMPPIFTTSLAERLGSISGKVCAEGKDGEVLKPGHIYVAPGNFHMSLSGTKKEPVIKLDQGELRNFVRPCADYLFESAAALYGNKTLGVVLTGMGRDGADGAAAIKAKNGAVLIQDKDSSVVFGMPGAVYENKNYDFMGTPSELAAKILRISQGLSDVA